MRNRRRRTRNGSFRRMRGRSRRSNRRRRSRMKRNRRRRSIRREKNRRKKNRWGGGVQAERGAEKLPKNERLEKEQ